MIVLHGRADSTNVQKVLWLFDELALPVRRIDRGGGFGGLDDAAFRALNPCGRVPVVEDEGLVLWESHAILRHYARSRPEARLWPEAEADRARVDMALDWVHTAFWPRLRPAYVALTGGEAQPGDAEIRAGLTAAEKALAALDWLLAGRDFVGGGAFSIGDIPPAVALHRYLWMDGGLERWPRIRDWQARVSARPPHAARLIVRTPART